MPSATFGEDSGGKRPTVQVGDPFAEKLLIEASLELIQRGLMEGLQDLGAAGITCAVSESADRAGTGICLDLDAMPRREPNMAPYEVMISESQERMLAIVRGDQLSGALEVCARWNLPAAIVGRVTDDGDITIVTGGVDHNGRPLPTSRELARIPARSLTSDAIVYDRLSTPPTHRRAAPAPGAPVLAYDGLPGRGMDPGLVLQALIGHPNLASRAWVTTQYDATVGADTVDGNEHAAAIIRIKGTRRALVMATDACERVGALDPWLGAAMAVAECARNVAVRGARPLGVTNCLNFGNPERPEAFWQLEEAVRGLGDACRALGLPVTGGDVEPLQRIAARSHRPHDAGRHRGAAGGRRPPRRCLRSARPATWCCLPAARFQVSPARSTRSSPGRRPTTGRRRSTSRTRRHSSASCWPRRRNGCSARPRM